MARTIPIGEQNFATLRKENLFYIDKTKFIKEWWSGHDGVTLITRPRRFGKTLMLNTVYTFFALDFAQQSELFADLEIWQDEHFRRLQGTIPVIYLSFANVKCQTFSEAIQLIKILIENCYIKFRYILQDNLFSAWEKEHFINTNRNINDADAKMSLFSLSEYIYRYHAIKPIILIDEYDTPMHAAWINGYWHELIDFMRIFFNSTFKTNTLLERGLITGITRISKESLFSDLNNLEVVGTTSDLYSDCFGFTEEEVFSALAEYGLTAKQEVKQWYDGFIFGSHKGIYNPWSIIGYLKKKTFAPYWGQTSSNAMVGQLIGQSGQDIKEETASLLRGEAIVTKFDEQIVFSQLTNKPGAIWSFLMAAGYVKPLSFDLSTNEYQITLTNHEVHIIFEDLISSWFNHTFDYGKKFRAALMADDVNNMNNFLQKIATSTFSFFDTGGEEPERFYHAFVLGLIVDMKEHYEIRSNRESGFGRYDVLLFPRNTCAHGIIIEFKTMQSNFEANLSATCQNALKQILTKQYAEELLDRQIDINNIYIYGFAFQGKKIQICGGALSEISNKLAIQ